MKEKIKLPQKIFYLCKRIIPLKDIYGKNKNKLKSIGAVYCFWWLGKRKELMRSEKRIILSGPGKKDVFLEHQDWFPKDLPFIPLYVGKTTKLKTRISQHLLRKLLNRVHTKPKNLKKVKPKTTSCQLRAGIEQIFPNKEKTLEFILENIGLSFIEEELPGRRFYLENFTIGYLRPWFNLDSER